MSLTPASELRPVTMTSVFWREEDHERAVTIQTSSWEAFAAKCHSQDLDPLAVVAGFIGDFAQTTETNGSDERRKAQEYVERAHNKVVGETAWWEPHHVALAWAARGAKR